MGVKRALIIAATGGFLRGFLTHDMKLLQNMGYEVHCAGNGTSVETFQPTQYFSEIGVCFHQIDFSSTKPISKESLIALKQYRRLMRKYHFDMVHVHTPIPGAIVRISSIFSRIRGCKIIYTTHGLAFCKGSSWKVKLAYGSTEWLCSWLSDAIITINHEDYNQICKMGCKRVFYINGVGVDTDRYHHVVINREEYRRSLGLQPTDIAVLEVGEISKRKNHKVIIDALSQLSNKNYVFLICGKVMTQNNIYKSLIELSEKRGVRTVFLGFRSDIPEINHCADIAVLPSLREGLGLAGIEALASGVPVVGSNVQGIKDYILDGKTGYLCEPTDASGFAEGISKLSVKENREAMAADCIKKAEEFRQEVSFRQMNDIYQTILEGAIRKE